MLRYARPPQHVVTADLGHAMMLVNYRTGRTHVLIGAATSWWRTLLATGDTTATDLSAETIRPLVHELVAEDFLCPAEEAGSSLSAVAAPPWEPSWGTHEHTAGAPPHIPVPAGRTLAAGLALAVVLAATATGPKPRRLARLTRLLGTVTRLPHQPATREEAEHAIVAVRAAGRLCPGRVACLEESAAATLLLAFSHRRVIWCHGAAGDPIRLHAWVETVQHEPVAEPASTARFATLRIIPAHPSRRREPSATPPSP
jgi:hypothetical protein